METYIYTLYTYIYNICIYIFLPFFKIFFFTKSKKNGCYKNDKHSWETSGVIKLNNGVREKGRIGLDAEGQMPDGNFSRSAIASNDYKSLLNGQNKQTKLQWLSALLCPMEFL